MLSLTEYNIVREKPENLWLKKKRKKKKKKVKEICYNSLVG